MAGTICVYIAPIPSSRVTGLRPSLLLQWYSAAVYPPEMDSEFATTADRLGRPGETDTVRAD